MALLPYVFVLACMTAVVLGHGFFSFPTPRHGPNTNSNPPCEPDSATSIWNTLPANQPISATWIMPHSSGLANDIQIGITPYTGVETTATVFTNVYTGTYTSSPAKITLNVAPGNYTMQWYQQSPGPYYNCANLQLTAPISTTGCPTTYGPAAQACPAGTIAPFALLVVLLAAIVCFF